MACYTRNGRTVMSARDRYRTVFGRIASLEETIPWTTGLSNLVEHMLWDTNAVLGISKTQFWKLVLTLADSPDCARLPAEEKVKFVEAKLKEQLAASNAKERYERGKHGYCSPSEALRRNKFFSENYLNKEFDIFLGLCSDHYLDSLYSRFFTTGSKREHLTTRASAANSAEIRSGIASCFPAGGSWSTHGNSGLFANSVDLWQMQMDNLAYNAKAGVLIANELKLGGRKNKDQILKYCFLFKELRERHFVSPSCSFLLLFISERKESVSWQAEVDQEIEHCKGKGKAKSHLVVPDVVQLRDHIQVDQLTWGEMIEFNKKYVDRLGPEQQVERKLISGFNSALLQKDAIVRARGEEVESFDS